MRMKDLGTALELGLVRWDDATEMWRPLARFDLDAPLYPGGQPIRYSDGGIDYFYFSYFLNCRVRADLKSVVDASKYEAFTCLAAGTRYHKFISQLDRRADESLNWGWKPSTSPIGAIEEKELIQSGKMKAEESHFLLHDAGTQRVVVPHYGSVCYNAFRKKWIQIAVETGGQNSFLGEVWYSEADSPTGPWYWARKIVTHNHYSFYNPVQHPFFDQEGGRVIYFEGTYTSTFSGNDHPTPLYDYNQIMYRLDLSDPRLAMPASR
jgi:hypothetical protein